MRTQTPVIPPEFRFIVGKLKLVESSRGEDPSQKMSQDSEMSTVKADLLEQILCHPLASKFDSSVFEPYALNQVNKDTDEYQAVENLFESTSRGLKIIKLERVENPYLLAQYILKKEKMEEEWYGIEEKLFFHGTDEENVDGICKFNFDWRRRGCSTGHKFGQGVSFSPLASYAKHYGKDVMFLVKVLVGRVTEGDYDTVVPSEPFDTTTNSASTVYVKYCDDDFYPEYVIHYSH